MPDSTVGPTESLQPVLLGVSDAINRAAREIVRTKSILDKAVGSQGAAMLCGDLHDGAYGPAEPIPFLQRILPFGYLMEEVAPYQPALVPTANTLGCSWKWCRNDLNDQKAQEQRERLDNHQALLDGTLDPATYHWIKPLGIFTPGEGKNRVDFFREEGIKSIPAQVSEWTYLEPHRIVIYSIKSSAFTATWAVLDGRWVENVTNPDWTLPLMTAYRVKTTERWPASFPAPQAIMLALFERDGFNSPLGNPEFGSQPVVDIETIRAISEFQDELVEAKVCDLKQVDVDPRIWMFGLLGVLLSCSMMFLMPAEWLYGLVGAGVVLGASACAALLPSELPVMTRRKRLEKEQYLPQEKSPKWAGRTTRRYLG